MLPGIGSGASIGAGNLRTRRAGSDHGLRQGGGMAIPIPDDH